MSGIFLILVFVLVPACMGATQAVQLYNASVTPLPVSSIPQFEKITRETHPITTPDQQSHWTLGHLYKLPLDLNQCNFSDEPTTLIRTSFVTSHILGSTFQGYACYMVKSIEHKSMSFFFAKSIRFEEQRLPVTRDQCKLLVSTLRDLNDVPLNKIRWNLYGSQYTTYAPYEWCFPTVSEAVNYYVAPVNITVSHDLSMIQVPNIEFQEPCHPSANSCDTNPLGIVIWGDDIQSPYHRQCVPRTYPNQLCLLSRSRLQCPEANILMHTMFNPLSCGRSLGLARAVLTSNLTNPTLLNSSDFIPVTADFDVLFNDTITYYSASTHMIVKQVPLCTPDHV